MHILNGRFLVGTLGFLLFVKGIFFSAVWRFPLRLVCLWICFMQWLFDVTGRSLEETWLAMLVACSRWESQLKVLVDSNSNQNGLNKNTISATSTLLITFWTNKHANNNCNINDNDLTIHTMTYWNSSSVICLVLFLASWVLIHVWHPLETLSGSHTITDDSCRPFY